MMALSGIMLSCSTDCVTAPIGSPLTGKLAASIVHPLSSPALTTRRINTANWRMDRTVTLH